MSGIGLREISLDSDEVGLMVNDAFRYGNEKKNAWIIDSGALLEQLVICVMMLPCLLNSITWKRLKK